MVVDELITLIRFDMPGNSFGALKKADGAVSTLTKRVRDLGIVSMATGAATAALSINAANEANSLQRASEVTGLTTKRLQQLQSVYKSVGGDAKNAAQDAEAFFRASGGEVMDDNSLEFLRSFTAGMDDASAAFKLQSAGFSDDIRRLINLGDEEFQKRMQYASDFHTLSQKEINDLNAVREAWVSFASSADTISERIQSSLSLPISTVLQDATNYLNKNKDTIIGGMNTISEGFSSAWETMKEVSNAAAPSVNEAWNTIDRLVQLYGGWKPAIETITLLATALSGFVAAATAAKALGIGASLLGVGGKTAAVATGGGLAAKAGAVGAAGATALGASIPLIAASAATAAYGLSELEHMNERKFGKDAWRAFRGMSDDEKRMSALEGNIPAIERGWGTPEMYRNRALERRMAMSRVAPWEAEPEISGTSAELQRKINRRISLSKLTPWGNTGGNPASVNVTNEIIINGVQGAADASDRLGEAAAQGTQSAIQTYMKQAYPSGYGGAR